MGRNGMTDDIDHVSIMSMISVPYITHSHSAPHTDLFDRWMVTMIKERTDLFDQ